MCAPSKIQRIIPQMFHDVYSCGAVEYSSIMDGILDRHHHQSVLNSINALHFASAIRPPKPSLASSSRIYFCSTFGWKHRPGCEKNVSSIRQKIIIAVY